jgi:hypothetical protein
LEIRNKKAANAAAAAWSLGRKLPNVGERERRSNNRAKCAMIANRDGRNRPQSAKRITEC